MFESMKIELEYSWIIERLILWRNVSVGEGNTCPTVGWGHVWGSGCLYQLLQPCGSAPVENRWFDIQLVQILIGK